MNRAWGDVLPTLHWSLLQGRNNKQEGKKLSHLKIYLNILLHLNHTSKDLNHLLMPK